MTQFTTLAYASAQSMRPGFAKNPVPCGFGLNIGGGQVLPEINFTLPAMRVERSNISEILTQYRDMITSILSRLTRLQVPGAVIEFEHAPQMTTDMEIGVRLTEQLKNLMREAHERDGLKTALRVTVCDIREQERPPRMRSGAAVARMLEAFEANARAGADLLSIESTGGKEVSDPALMEGDLPGLLLALGILAPRDVRDLWTHISAIAADTQTVPAGDTACAFGNTAMVLADQSYIPNVLAAVVRAMSSVRTFVAHEVGAVGPTKDCAYEGPVLKAITGCPVSLEGRTAACAHFSHMGNIAGAVCDLWSNESVQNVRLLSGYAPEVFTEMLAYDCRLYNTAIARGEEKQLRDLFIASDIEKSVHALVISPASSVKIAKAILSDTDDFQRTRKAGLAACSIIRAALRQKQLVLPKRETSWLDRIETALNEFASAEQVMEEAGPRYKDKFLAAEYGL